MILKKTTEQVLQELDTRYGNPKGPSNYKIIVEAIERFRQTYEELQSLKTEKS